MATCTSGLLPGGQASYSRWAVCRMFWKVACAMLLLLLLVREYSNREVPRVPQEHIASQDGMQASAPDVEIDPQLKVSPTPDAQSVELESWRYAWGRDGNKQGLSAGQCELAFPELYHEIYRAKQHFDEQDIIEEDIDLFGGNEGGVRLLVLDSQVRIVETRGLDREDFRHRIIAVVQQVVQALAAADASGEPIPTSEFTIVVDDIPALNGKRPGALWSFTRKYADRQHDNVWLIPDFHFFGAPPEAEGFRTMQTKCRTHDSPLEQKIPHAVWRGAIWTNEALRSPLLAVTAGKEWANVSAMDWDDPGTVISTDEFCKYRYTINTEGRSWSARMTHLFNCDSLLFIHEVEWIAHYYHLLETGVNSVHVDRDFHDLERQVHYYNEHLDEAQRLADQARRTFRERYTTPAATACYWRKLMRTWAETVTFAPRIDVAKDGHRMKKTRGITFEEFIVHRNDVDYPYKNEDG